MDSRHRIGAWGEISRILKRNQTDILHSHGARAGWYGRIGTCRASKVRIISTVHNSLRDYPYPEWRKRLYVMAERLTSPWVSQWIAVSEGLRQDLVQYYGLPNERIRVIPNGIDLTDLMTTRSREELRKELGLRSDSLVFVSIGRLTNQKGHRFLLDALNDIRRAIPEVRLLLVGDGPMRPQLEDQVSQMGLQREVSLLGFRDDVSDLIGASDIYVLPSLSEGMPMGLLEAMALGCPVVASTVAGVTEVVKNGENGRLVSPKDVSELKAALLELARDEPLRLRLGRAGKETVSREFTAERMASSVASLYRSCLQHDIQVNSG